MKLSEMLLPEFDNEMAKTRKSLERAPEDKFDWRPHEKSMSLRSLVTHMANLPTWTNLAIEQDSFNMQQPADASSDLAAVQSVEELLTRFDKNIAAARAAIENASNETFGEMWTLLSGERKVFSMPRMPVLRNFVMNHMIHHRAQLGVYLRLLDVPVPSNYGPTADETGM